MEICKKCDGTEYFKLIKEREDIIIMNKNELITSISEVGDLTKKDSKVVLDVVVETIEESLLKGEEVRIVDFGVFSLKNKPNRTGRNPATGETITIAAKSVPVFKFTKSFKERINI